MYSLIATVAVLTATAAPLELKKGDRICLLGNTLAERMQHSGWMETLLTSRFPQHDLAFRNLGFSGDELTLRLRSAGFGSPDQHLTHSKADVVFAFFGYNESFAGAEGLPKFRADLDAFIKSTRKQKYNGQSAPRLAIFSPIAHENLKSPTLPDGKENNLRLEAYTAAMAEVSRENQVPFVNLFHPTLNHYPKAKQPLTINGIHLNDHGDEFVGRVIDKELFGDKSPVGDPKKLRQAILDRNFVWFNRYRTVDGYSIYGGRADLKFVAGQTNRVVMQREMEILDEMTANRDRRVWAIARGSDQKVDDADTKPFLDVVTNKPGKGPEGKHLFLGGEEAIKLMKVHSNMKVNLFASEEQFPILANPVQMAFDPKGRLWVACMPSYPHWKPKDEMDDKILILEDTDGDGRADTCKVFADKLHVPTGLEFYNGGLLVGQQPDLLYLKDTDGDDKADIRERWLHGIDSADTHHALNSFTLDPGGAMYFQEGTFHHTQIETPYGPPVRNVNAGVFRFEPRTKKIEVYINYGFANPHGHVFDRWGQDFVTDGTGNVNYFAAPFSGKMDWPKRHSGYKPFFQQKTRPSPGTEILSSGHFPPELQGNYLNANVISFQGILQYKFLDKGSGFGAVEVEPIVSSSDPNFRPADMEMGPDGALYFCDWQNPIIGHMQHNLRDPSRDQTHGRVYRVTYEDRPLLKPAKIAGAPIENVLDVLKSTDDRVRHRARIELGGRQTEDVMAAVGPWIAKLDPKDPNHEHHLLEALWLHQSHNQVHEGLLAMVLGSKEPRARAAATRVLCYQREGVKNALELLKKQAGDAHPRVRLEAVRAASFFNVPEALDVPLIAEEKETDFFLEYCLGETRKALDPIVKAAIAANKPIPFTSPAAARMMLRNISVDQLLKLPRDKTVYRELLLRPGIQDDIRRDSLKGFAKLEQKPETQVLIDAIAYLDGKPDNRDEKVVFELVRLFAGRPRGELTAARAELEKLAANARQPIIRQFGYVSLMTIDNGVDGAWKLALASPAQLNDLLQALPLISDTSLRAGLYPKIEPLLHEPPAHFNLKYGKEQPIAGRYVRVEIPGKATLTLSEVEVFSGGKNVARKGRATQSSIGSGGDASRGIDGNKSPNYSSGGLTHTAENTKNPWWEVDLGQMTPIESIEIYNRHDGLHKRLDGYTLKILDADRKIAWERTGNRATMEKAVFAVSGGSGGGLIRQNAMLALTAVRGQEGKTFKTLAEFILEDTDRLAAVRAVQRLPRSVWPKEQANPLLAAVLPAIRKIPVKERTQPEALDLLEFADGLSTLLPPAEGKKVRAELGELGVRVIRLGTLPERMSYDKDVLVLKAGQPVEFLFENFDFMPHNFAILKPGTLEEIGKLAEATANDPESAARHFIPKSGHVLLGSRLLQARESQRLSFTAPTQPGVYPYVCTYPGHWMRMYGALYVVADPDAYQANPEEYLAGVKLPILDPLLKDRRPRTEWKFDELALLVADLKGGRNFGNGKQMFTVASCVACHKLDNVGNNFAPDLATLDAKLTIADLLKEVIEPSHKINEKFQSYAFETKAGKTFTGLILEETKDVLKIVENPLTKAEPILVKTADLEARQKLPVSMMPKGLLDKLTRDEILDLIAYVMARGKREHPFFQADDHKH